MNDRFVKERWLVGSLLLGGVLLFLAGTLGAAVPKPASAPDSTDGKVRIICFGAHPDDNEFRAGGVAAMWAARGHHVKFVSCTNGDIGHWGMAGGPLAQRRTAEVERCADIFGIEMSKTASSARAKRSRSREKVDGPKRKKVSKTSAKRVVKKKAKAIKKTTRGKKPSTSKKVRVKKTSRAVLGVRTVTGKDVAKLRAKFDMSKAQFAKLLGVSAPSINNWEKKARTLNLQPRTLKIWNSVKGITKRQALNRLNDS